MASCEGVGKELNEGSMWGAEKGETKVRCEKKVLGGRSRNERRGYRMKQGRTGQRRERENGDVEV